MAALFRLQCEAQQYAWGKIGSASKVAQYAASTPGFTIDESKTYAELWMGSHPNAPSKVLETKESLGALIKANPALSTERCHKAYEGDLPFLFKILSVNLALSIQAHPDKKLARELFNTRPEIYKDPNHKPEMAIALTPFEALCGFRQLPEIASFLEQYPEFRAVVGQKTAEEFCRVAKESKELAEQKRALKDLFGILMRADPLKVSTELGALVRRIAAMPVQEQQQGVNELVKRLNDQFPNDVGCFCVFTMNFMTLKPGEAIFLAANLPHAYISGDCVECMATSDNVVRAGLTPKLRDVDTLVNMLDYNFGPASEFIVEGKPFQGSSHSCLYDTPVPEFNVIRSSFKEGEAEDFQGLMGPSILVVTSGNGTLSSGSQTVEVGPGHVYFISADAKISLKATGNEFHTYRAYCDRIE